MGVMISLVQPALLRLALLAGLAALGAAAFGQDEIEGHLG
jgi:hypothetical protein